MYFLNLNMMLIICFSCLNVSNCDLSIFPNEQIELEINKANLKYDPNLDVMTEKDGKLSIFTAKDCYEPQECDVSLIDKESFCHDYCTVQISQILEASNQQGSCHQDGRTALTPKPNITSDEELNETKKLLSSEGFLFYYRQFVHTFLDEINHEELTDESSNFNMNLYLTMHQINKLKQFANSLNNTEASMSIQEATDILNNMYSHVEYFKPDEFAESISKIIISIAVDPRVQIALFLIIIVMTMFTILINQIRKHKFSIRSLIITLLVLFFIVSVVNNHFLIMQKNQILKNQKLNEKIPDECFGSNMAKSKDNENSDLLSSTISHLKSYFKLKPTSQVCLEYQEALLLDSKHANFIETIIFTITEAIRPISMLFGESINLFYSSLTKNLSFYQYMPLMTVVTIVAVPLLVYMMSLLSLVFFGYEFNFFHLISFKKGNGNSNNSEQLMQQTDLLKILAVLKKENEVISEKLFLNSREENSQNKKIGTSMLVPAMKELTMSNSSDIEPIFRAETVKSIEDSIYTEKKPDSYYNEPILEDEIPAESNTTVNESLCEEVVKYVNNTNKSKQKIMEKNEILEYENKKLKEMIFYQKANESIAEESKEENKENCGRLPALSPICTNQILIGNSKTLRKQSNSVRSLKNSYIKDVSDNDFGDDDEDIVVILDEK